RALRPGMKLPFGGRANRQGRSSPFGAWTHRALPMAEPTLDALVDALRRLPGVGIKSAQRMAFHLLQHDRDGARRIARSLDAAVASIRHCERCHTFTEA